MAAVRQAEDLSARGISSVRLMTDIDVGKIAILDLGSEDYYHLADAAAYLPTIAPERRAEVARVAMRELLRDGLVQLVFGEFATNAFQEVPLAEALRVIDDPGAWDVEAYHPKTYAFLNTDAGDAVYRGNASRRSNPTSA